MLEFTHTITGNQAEISFGCLGLATVLGIQDRVNAVTGYVSHEIDRDPESGIDTIRIIVQSDNDINNCVEQAKVVLGGQ